MRPVVDVLDSAAMPWAVNGGLATKVLNTDLTDGGRTVLLRSDPRPLTEATRRRAHCHDGTEEFLNLGPRFSFDGGVWIENGAYVHLPPGTVHGTDVRVPDGYLLFLRTVGSAVPKFVAANETPNGMTVRPVMPGGNTVQRLSPGAALIQLPPNFSDRFPMELPDGVAEVFVVDGGFQNAHLTMRPGNYACLPANALAGPVTSASGARILVIAASAVTGS